MDIIQSTVTLFSGLLQKVKTIGDMIVVACLPEFGEVKTRSKFSWIFNW